MQHYKALTFLRVPAGSRVKITPAQYSRRRHLLEETDKSGVYLVRAPCGFKAGEEFATDGELAKSQAQDVEALDGPSTLNDNGDSSRQNKKKTTKKRG